MNMRFISVLLASILLISYPMTVAAQSIALSSSQIELISAYCTEAKGHLERLHSADALQRVNLGQRYENISTKLMAPLNSRIALAGHDGLDLTKTAIEFNQELTNFRKIYLKYDNQINDIIHMDCKDQPVEFYQQLEESREKRQELSDSVDKLGELIERYQAEFESYAANTNQGAQ